MKIAIVGAGPGDWSLVSPVAQDVIRRADCVLTTERLFSQFLPLNAAMYGVKMSEIAARIEAEAELEKSQSGSGNATELEKSQPGSPMAAERQVVILVSGDVGFFSLSTVLKPVLAGYALEWINGFSSLQVLAALLQIPYEQVKVVSAHGRSTWVVPHVCYHPAVFVLTGGAIRAHDVLAQLIDAGLGEVQVAVGEHLSAPRQRLLQGTARELGQETFDDLAVLLIQNPSFTPPWQTLRDTDLERGPVPMTKQEVRDVCVSRLDIQPTDLVYDIGAGTGAVAIAMARKAAAGKVLAIEKNPAALELLAKNRARLGAFNLEIVAGLAPEALAELPPPDKVFIGGSSGQIAPILDLIRRKNAQARVVITAITLETLQETLGYFKKLPHQPEVVCLNVSRAETIGRYNLMQAQNPIYIISGGLSHV